MRIQYLKLITSLVVCQLAGIIGSVFTVSAIPTWYAQLDTPFFNPPSDVFAPVWITLYLLMGISLYIIWSKGVDSRQSKLALILFAIQLVLNSLWSIIFFGSQAPLLAFIEILFLWTAIVLTMVYFYRISRAASYLLIPYILWVSFAAVLNFAIFYLNPKELFLL